MTELILVRHGETDWNRELRFQGQVDPALNAVGMEQARRVAQRLASEKADSLYASDLLRAQQTAQPVAGTLGLPLGADAGLREQSFGIVDGMRSDDIQREHPEAWAGFLRFNPDFCMPEGESTRQFHARVMDAVLRLANSHEGQTLVVVTHGGVLDMVYRTARSLGLDGPRQSEIPNGGINRVRVTGTTVDIVSWCEVAHLAGMPAQPVYDQQKIAVRPSQPAAVPAGVGVAVPAAGRFITEPSPKAA